MVLLLCGRLVLRGCVMAGRLRWALLMLRVLVDLLLLSARLRSGVITTTITRVIGIMSVGSARADPERLTWR